MVYRHHPNSASTQSFPQVRIRRVRLQHPNSTRNFPPAASTRLVATPDDVREPGICLCCCKYMCPWCVHTHHVYATWWCVLMYATYHGHTTRTWPSVHSLVHTHWRDTRPHRNTIRQSCTCTCSGGPRGGNMVPSWRMQSDSPVYITI